MKKMELIEISLPWALSKSAWDVIDEWCNLLDLESHDQVRGEVNSTLGMVADGSSSGEGEDLGDGAADELEWVVLKTSRDVLQIVLIWQNFVGNFIRLKK